MPVTVPGSSGGRGAQSPAQLHSQEPVGVGVCSLLTPWGCTAWPQRLSPPPSVGVSLPHSHPGWPCDLLWPQEYNKVTWQRLAYLLGLPLLLRLELSCHVTKPVTGGCERMEPHRSSPSPSSYSRPPPLTHPSSPIKYALNIRFSKKPLPTHQGE